MLRMIAAAALLASACYSHRYFWVPHTEEGMWCLNYCINDQVRCVDSARLSNSRSTCQRYADNCVAGCHGAVEVSYEEWLGDGGTQDP